jgi:serine/threonine-protein kinase
MNREAYLEKARKGLAHLASHSFENYRLVQSPPYRSFNFGAAGVAYLFWKAACLLEETDWLHYARLWIDHVLAAPEDDPEILDPDRGRVVHRLQVRDSFYYGNRGVYFVQALIAHAEDDPRALASGLRAFNEESTGGLKDEELLEGMAGRLVGCALLYRETGLDALKTFGDGLAKALEETAATGDGVPWETNPRLGLAHGRAGNYYGLLVWAHAAGYEPPGWVWQGLERYAGSGVRHGRGVSWPVSVQDESAYMNSWCNGAPGLVHLWALAYRLTENPLYLETARKTAAYAADQPDHRIAHLCCGAAGAAYGLLALHRVDPGGDWLAQAEKQAALCLEGVLEPEWHLSLYKGEAGRTSLMLDLAYPSEARQPGMI